MGSDARNKNADFLCEPTGTRQHLMMEGALDPYQLNIRCVRANFQEVTEIHQDCLSLSWQYQEANAHSETVEICC